MTGNDTLSPAHEPTITAQAARSGGAMFLAKSIRFGFILLVNFILINLLLPADFGMIRYVLLIVGIANLLNEMGLTTAIVQKKELDTTLLLPLVIISTLWALFIYAILFAAAPFAAHYFSTPELTLLLRAGAIMIPVTGVTAVHRAWMRRQMAFGRLAFIESAAAVLSAVASVGLALSGFGVWSLVAGYLIFEGVNSAVLLVTCRIPVAPLPKTALLTPLLTFGIAIVGARIIDYILCNAPFFLIGKVIGKEGLGLFSVAHDIAVFPQMAINAVLGLVLIATFSRVQSDPQRIASGFSRIQMTGALAATPVLLVMAFMPTELLHIICMIKKNSAWLGAAPLLHWLALMGIFYVFTTFSAAIWLSQGKIAASAGVSLLMCITIIAAILPGSKNGLEGIAAALFIRSAAVFPLYMYLNFLVTRITVQTYFMSCFPSLIAGTAMAGVLYALEHLIPGTTLPADALRLAAGSIAGSAVYMGVIVLFFRDSLETVRQLVLSIVRR